MCFQKRKSALVGVFLEKNPMTNKIKKFLYILEHLIPDGRDEIPTFALYHPLLPGFLTSIDFLYFLLVLIWYSSWEAGGRQYHQRLPWSEPMMEAQDGCSHSTRQDG